MATETKAKRKGWPRIGSIRVGENKETKVKYTYMKLEDNVEIYVDGAKIPLKANRTLKFDKPSDEVERLRDLGILDEKKAAERLEKLAEMTWLRYQVTAPPPQDKK